MRIRFVAELRAWRSRLLPGGARGEEVYAGSFLRKREIVLATELLGRPKELARIFLHELFHFVWLRGGNSLRRSYEAVLEHEFRRHARGELGWSAERRKQALAEEDRAGRTRRWREYACESFCDSAACLLGPARVHQEFTLAPRFRRARRYWFERLVFGRRISI